MPTSPHRYRTLFISDVHLGTRCCQSRALLEFLRAVDASTIYLVGDIIDGWRLETNWYWPQEHRDIMQRLLQKIREGVRLIYIPGNHDEFLRRHLNTCLDGIELVDSAIHHTADGRRFLVVHGDRFDIVMRRARWLAALGDMAYGAALVINSHVNQVRQRFGFAYWSLSQWAKLRVKGAVNFIGDYERALVWEAHQQGVDGIICGHIHHAVIEERAGLTYVNCGDWVESCTAVAETFNGELRLIHWQLERTAPDLGSRRLKRKLPAITLVP